MVTGTNYVSVRISFSYCCNVSSFDLCGLSSWLVHLTVNCEYIVVCECRCCIMDHREPVKCVICGADIERGVDGTRVSEKGLQTLRKASLQRKDGKHENFEGVTSLIVHTSCRKQYTRPSSVKAAAKSPTTSTSRDLRSSQDKFDFQTKCFLCCETINLSFYEKQKRKPPEERRLVYSVRSLSVKDKVEDEAERRNDRWGNEVKLRLSIASDLVAADGIYHHDYYVRFFTHHTASKKRGRPQEDYVAEAMDEISDYIDKNVDSQLSGSELLDSIRGQRMNERTLKKKLKEKYGASVIITERQGRPTVITLRGTGQRILTDTWYKARKGTD